MALEIVLKVKQLRFESSCKLERPMFIYLPMTNIWARQMCRCKRHPIGPSVLLLSCPEADASSSSSAIGLNEQRGHHCLNTG